MSTCLNQHQAEAVESDDRTVVNISQLFMTTWSTSLEGRCERQ
jgi:hypothetical protein